MEFTKEEKEIIDWFKNQNETNSFKIYFDPETNGGIGDEVFTSPKTIEEIAVFMRDVNESDIDKYRIVHWDEEE